MTTHLKDLPPRLQDRYGYRPASKIWIGLGVVLCIALLGLGVFLANNVGNPETSYKLLAFNPAAADHTTVTFEVRHDPATSVRCVLRVQDKDHVDLGYAEVTIPPGKNYNQVSYQVATNDFGYAAEVLGCAPMGDPLPVYPPQFPPNAPNPPQPWRP